MATATGEPDMSPLDAAREIVRVQGLTGALARRATGLTWMLWGIVTPAIFVSYTLGAALIESGVKLAPFWMGVVWLPWTALGIIATMAIWKSAGMIAPALDSPSDGLKAGAFFIVAFLGGFWGARLAGVPVVEPAIGLAIVGLISLTLSVVGLFHADRLERALLGGTAALVAVVLAVGLASVGNDEELAYLVFGLAAPVVTAVGWFGTGFVLTVRG